MTESFTVSTQYDWKGSFRLDEVAEKAVGRNRDGSGCGFGERDLAWWCDTEAEAEQIKRALEGVGLPAEITRS